MKIFFDEIELLSIGIIIFFHFNYVLYLKNGYNSYSILKIMEVI